MLEKAGEKTADWSTILAYMLCSRLDPVTLRHWETYHNSNDVPVYENLMLFLRGHCAVLQSVAPAKGESRSMKSTVCHTVTKVGNKCPFCGEFRHTPFQCGRFQRMTLAEKNEAVFKNALCRNCLQAGHYSRSCERGSCRHCHQKHHTMLHPVPSKSSVPPAQEKTHANNNQWQRANTQVRPMQSKPQNFNQNSHPHTQSNNTQATNKDSHLTNRHTTTDTATTFTTQNYVALPVAATQNVLLSTALVKIRDQFGNTMLARALLDSCSQHCLMSKTFSNKLKFREHVSYLSVQGIGSSQAVSTKSVVAFVTPRSHKISEYEEEMQFYVLSQLTVSLPTSSVDTTRWILPETNLLADPQFYESGPIDIIIGAEFYMDLLCQERQKATSDGPTLQKTLFGWIISGKVPREPYSYPYSVVNVCSTTQIADQLTKFWELETCRTTSVRSLEETSCEEFFERTMMRDVKGRFVVCLPKKQHLIEQLGESKAVATKRLLGLERRFVRNSELKQQYAEFIHEYLRLGHMNEVGNEDNETKAYYLPHHAVLKPDSTTTKLRVVFDASCATSTGVSLNDALMVGPVVQEDLMNIVLRFRLHQYAVVADIAKMYRMVQVHPSDKPLQRILWRDRDDQPIRTYELSTVTYGTASAPYLATKCLQVLAAEGESTYPAAAKILKHDFYVDDMLSGVQEIHEGKVLIQDMIALLESGGFSLRKWNSNSKELLLDIPESLRDERTVWELDSSRATVKTLGLVWEPSSDTFKFAAPSWQLSAVITKRIVLSDVSRLFDPLGIMGPVIIQAKVFIQDLWKRECGWDDPLEPYLQEQWEEFRRNLAALDNLIVPRWVGLSADTVAVELHGFCDASEKAYGACIYVRTVSNGGAVLVRILTAKSRVAPLENLKKAKRQQSIPRLELSSALLLAHLYEKVIISLRLEAKSYFWTDSMIVKCWLSSSPSRWKHFIANRVSEIQHVTKKGSWKHVPGVENPADIISRGMTPAQLYYQPLWFHGPNWLTQDESYWPPDSQIREEDLEHSVLEEKAVTMIAPANSPSEIFGLRASLTELTRIVAYMCRFRWNSQSKNRDTRRLGLLSSCELNEALKLLVRLSQKESFPVEYAELSRGRCVKDSSRIGSLNPVLMEGIICVGGRLKNAHISFGRKHPYIVDHRHPLARIVVTHHHRKLFHAGQQLVLSAVRGQFWPTNARNLVRSILHGCVQCFRQRPKVHQQLMADLPPERVTPCSPFTRVGVDYCGPFLIRYPYRRNQPVKGFVAIYICLVTKAVHLELAADLSTHAFLATLKRFTARRGMPQQIMCDNATNFVGARREMAELRNLFYSQQFQDSVIKATVDDQIDFKFIPPRSPNFGGLWESAVKSFKTLFKRTVGTHSLVYDEMQVVLAQIEAVLNSRPLTPLSSDPNDYEALTPGHFLIHRPLTAPPEPDLTATPENRLTKWQKTEQFVQLLWKKWSTQYLSDLNNRTKWTKSRNNIAVGMMVVLKEDNLPPLRWQLARVVEVHAGSDGNVRVVTVQTKDGIYRRAVSKICVLPIRDNSSTDGEKESPPPAEAQRSPRAS